MKAINHTLFIVLSAFFAVFCSTANGSKLPHTFYKGEMKIQVLRPNDISHLHESFKLGFEDLCSKSKFDFCEITVVQIGKSMILKVDLVTPELEQNLQLMRGVVSVVEGFPDSEGSKAARILDKPKLKKYVVENIHVQL